MAIDLFLASVEALIKEMTGRRHRVQNSLSILQHQDSSYAQDHRALLAAYDEALVVLRRHRDQATNAKSPIIEEPSVPPLPPWETCEPPWDGQSVEHFGVPMKIKAPCLQPDVPLSYQIGDRKVLSMEGAHRVFSDLPDLKDSSNG